MPSLPKALSDEEGFRGGDVRAVEVEGREELCAFSRRHLKSLAWSHDGDAFPKPVGLL